MDHFPLDCESWVLPVLPILASGFILDMKNNVVQGPLALFTSAEVLIFVRSGNPLAGIKLECLWWDPAEGYSDLSCLFAVCSLPGFR